MHISAETGNLGGTPLHVAVALQQPHTVKVLLSYWKDRNLDVSGCQFVLKGKETLDKGPLPMSLAIANDDAEVCQLLVKAKANVKTRYRCHWRSPLESAIAHDSKNCQMYFIENFSAEQLDVDSQTSVPFTLALPDVDFLAFLLHRFPRVDISAKTLHHACFAGTEAVRLLLASGH